MLHGVFNMSIICFGDSLTYGWHADPESEPTPYSADLARSLQGQRVETYGMPGEKTGHMIDRLKALLQNAEPRTVIILGGTNDIGTQRTAQEIYGNLQALHQIALEKAKNSVAVAIPYHGLEEEQGWQFIGEKRREINLNLKQLADHNPRIRYVSLEALSPKVQTEGVWEDRVHLTARGNQILASLIAQEVRFTL